MIPLRLSGTMYALRADKMIQYLMVDVQGRVGICCLINRVLRKPDFSGYWFVNL